LTFGRKDIAVTTRRIIGIALCSITVALESCSTSNSRQELGTGNYRILVANGNSTNVDASLGICSVGGLFLSRGTSNTNLTWRVYAGRGYLMIASEGTNGEAVAKFTVELGSTNVAIYTSSDSYIGWRDTNRCFRITPRKQQ
jgi:hypothetical protein